MTTLDGITQQAFGDVTLRTGYSSEHQASYIVAADLRKAVGFKSSTTRFLATLEGVRPGTHLYVGDESIETPGGRQKMKVLYKRGVFQVLMRSDMPGAVQWRDEIFDLLEKLEHDGFAISPAATVEQLESASERARQEIEELLARRRREQLDYRSILHAICNAGGHDRDYADVQNLIYLGLFGHSAKTIVARQKQINGDRYKRGAMAGQLKPSQVAKDRLTAEQLKTLETGVLMMNSMLGLRHPDGRATLDDIKDAAMEVARQASAGRAARH